MEPVTHVLTGACLARAGCNRRAAYATLVMAVAAEFPDIDTLWGLRGPIASFTHHRGITHTFVGIPFEAALLTGLAYGLHRWRVARAARKGDARPLTVAPVRWGVLYGFAVLALLSHIFLDFTNNYGVRPFFPFNPRWYAGSFVFIFDPLLFLLLLTALAVPSLLRLVGSEIGARKQPFRGRSLARTVLVLMALYDSGRAWAHARAMDLARAESVAEPHPATSADGPADPNAPLPTPPPDVYLQPRRVLASPDPFNPLRWYAVMDFGNFYQLGTVDLHADTVVLEDVPYWKPAATPALQAAEASRLGRSFLDWSPMPIVSAERAGRGDAGAPEAAATVVTFSDPRFMGDSPLLHASGHTPLTGVVVLDANNRVLRQTMDGSTPDDQPPAAQNTR